MSYKIVIIGAGEVGTYLAGMLSSEGHEVTVIDSDDTVVQSLEESFNARALVGNGASSQMLIKAGINECDFCLAMTSDDLTNLVGSSLGKSLGAKCTLARIHDQTYMDNSYINYQLHFGIDYLINPEALCALELAKIIRNPGRMIVEHFAKGAIEVQQVEVSANSKLLNKDLQTLNFPKGIQIAYIQDKEEFVVPNASSKLEAGKTITMMGPTDELAKLVPKINPDATHSSVYITIFGGTETAICLARMLNPQRFRVRIIEKNVKQCRSIAERFPDITVINGDATSLRLMEEENVGESDFFIACSKDDEDNIMTCLQAKKLGTKHTQLVVNRTDYENLLDDLRDVLKVEKAVSPRVATVKELNRYLSTKPYMELATLPGGMIISYEIVISTDSPCAGKTVKSIGLPPGAVIIALQHKYEVRVPLAHDVLLSGDRIIIIMQKAVINLVMRIFDI